MKINKLDLFISILFIMSSTAFAQTSEEGWITLFDGETLNNWAAAENPETFSIEDGKIVVDGPRAHLFYNGPVENHDFDDFVLNVR